MILPPLLFWWLVYKMNPTSTKWGLDVVLLFIATCSLVIISTNIEIDTTCQATVSTLLRFLWSHQSNANITVDTWFHTLWLLSLFPTILHMSSSSPLHADWFVFVLLSSFLMSTPLHINLWAWFSLESQQILLRVSSPQNFELVQLVLLVLGIIPSIQLPRG